MYYPVCALCNCSITPKQKHTKYTTSHLAGNPNAGTTCKCPASTSVLHRTSSNPLRRVTACYTGREVSGQGTEARAEPQPHPVLPLPLLPGQNQGHSAGVHRRPGLPSAGTAQGQLVSLLCKSAAVLTRTRAVGGGCSSDYEEGWRSNHFRVCPTASLSLSFCALQAPKDFPLVPFRLSNIFLSCLSSLFRFPTMFLLCPTGSQQRSGLQSGGEQVADFGAPAAGGDPRAPGLHPARLAQTPAALLPADSSSKGRGPWPLQVWNPSAGSHKPPVPPLPLHAFFESFIASRMTLMSAAVILFHSGWPPKPL